MTDGIQRLEGKSSAPASAQAAFGYLEVGKGVSEVAHYVLGRCGVFARNKSGALHRVNSLWCRARFVARINTTPTQHALHNFRDTLANFQVTQGRLRARWRTAFALETLDSVSQRLS